MNIEQAKTIPIDLVLHAIGAREPVRTAKGGKDVWFHSPLRKGDSEASFVAHPQRGTWKDFGTGAGGDVIALAQAHLNGASVSEALRWLERFAGESAANVAAHPTKARTTESARFTLVKKKPLSYAPILSYITERGIRIDTARRYCSEIYYQPVAEKRLRPLFGVGFPTDDPNTWEVRSIRGDYKTVIGSKSTTTLFGDAEQEPEALHLFEGFFDFLTYADTCGLRPSEAALILNSAGLARRGLQHLVEASRLRSITSVFTWFDNDPTGRAITQRYADALSARYAVIDMSSRYSEHNDLNAAHVAHKKAATIPSWVPNDSSETLTHDRSFAPHP